VKLLLSDRHLEKREEFARFADQEMDADGQFPRDNLQKAAERGYMGLPIPEKYGGRGEDFLTYILLLEEVSRVCASTGVIMAVHTSVGSFPLLYYGNAAQKEKYLPGLAGGSLIGAFALTEAGAGSDAAALSTKAEACDEGYLLNGNKLFITSGGEADLYTIFATLDRSAGRKGICAFLVEKTFKGLRPGEPERKMGLKRSLTTELQIENMPVPSANLLGREGEGFNIAMSLLDGGRIGIAAQGLGLARASIEYTRLLLKKREVGRPGTARDAACILAGLETRFEAARLLTYRAAVLKENGVRCSAEASMAKAFSTDLAVDAAIQCMDICGREHYSAGGELARYFCDAKATQIYEGTNQIQRIVVAREMLK